VNVIEFVVLPLTNPLRFTVQLVPPGRPTSVKVTVHVSEPQGTFGFIANEFTPNMGERIRARTTMPETIP